MLVRQARRALGFVAAGLGFGHPQYPDLSACPPVVSASQPSRPDLWFCMGSYSLLKMSRMRLGPYDYTQREATPPAALKDPAWDGRSEA